MGRYVPMRLDRKRKMHCIMCVMDSTLGSETDERERDRDFESVVWVGLLVCVCVCV